MKLLKKIFKNILAFLLLLIAILWIAIPFLFLVIKAYFRGLNNFIDRKETNFPEIFSKDFYSEIKKDIKEYFNMELWEQSLSCLLLMIFFTYFNILSKWSFNKNGGSAVAVTPF